MSVIVTGVDIPEDCDGCWHPTCNLWLQTDVGKRHKDCPISPMPEKHGTDFCEAFAVIAEAYKADPDNEILRDYMLKNACCMDWNEGS